VGPRDRQACRKPSSAASSGTSSSRRRRPVRRRRARPPRSPQEAAAAPRDARRSPTSRRGGSSSGCGLDDLLVLDRGGVEKERDGRWIVALYNVDGATIRPNIDDRGGYHDDAYVQLVDGQVTARFGMEELVVAMDNEQTDVRFAGYGLSPLESLIISVTADLHAAKFNASYFEKGAVPEGILDLGEDVAPRTSTPSGSTG
jgi:hypothetical protein